MENHISPAPHPYLRRVNEVIPACTSSSSLQDSPQKPSSGSSTSRIFERLKAPLRLLASAHAFLNPERHSLTLRPLSLCLLVPDFFSDDLIDEVYEEYNELSHLKEYPHLYVILDDSSSPDFRKCIDCLQQQKTMIVLLDGQTSTNKPEHDILNFRPFVLIVATDHFIFLFDWIKLGSKKILEFSKFWLESATVHKIVYRFERQEEFLRRKYGIKVCNYYDVVCAEKRLEKLTKQISLDNYSIRRFQQRYKNRSKVFRMFPDEDFQYRPLEFARVRPSTSLSQLPRNVLFDCVKQCVYLGIIKKCQTDVFMRKIRMRTENAVLDVFIAADQWAIGGSPKKEDDYPEPAYPNEEED